VYPYDTFPPPSSLLFRHHRRRNALFFLSSFIIGSRLIKNHRFGVPLPFFLPSWPRADKRRIFPPLLFFFPRCDAECGKTFQDRLTILAAVISSFPTPPFPAEDPRKRAASFLPPFSLPRCWGRGGESGKIDDLPNCGLPLLFQFSSLSLIIRSVFFFSLLLFNTKKGM